MLGIVYESSWMMFYYRAVNLLNQKVFEYCFIQLSAFDSVKFVTPPVGWHAECFLFFSSRVRPLNSRVHTFASLSKHTHTACLWWRNCVKLIQLPWKSLKLIQLDSRIHYDNVNLGPIISMIPVKNIKYKDTISQMSCHKNGFNHIIIL
jgi:hypothetical protein